MLTALAPFAGGIPAGVAQGDSVYLSAVTGEGSTLLEEARSAWALALGRLEEAGVGAEGLVRVVEYVAGRALDEYASLDEAQREALGTQSPAVGTVVVPGLVGSDRRLGLEIVASRGGPERALPGATLVDGTVYLSSVLPVDANGRLVGEEDLAAQLDRAFANAEAVLGRLGLGLQNVVLTVDHTTPATRKDYRQTGAVRRERLGPVFPGAAGILQERMAHPGALVSLDIIATRYEVQAVNPGWERYARLTYSPAVRAGKTLFMAGQGALDPETEEALYTGDLRAQTEYTYRNVEKVLQAAGLAGSDLVQTVEYLTPAAAEQAHVVDEARAEVFGDHPMATTRVLCAGLLRPEFLIEVIPLAAWQ